MNQDTALDILKSGKNVFLTGSAGTGKTYVLNKYIDFLKEREVKIAVTAPTGIAASHLNGVTIHSFFGLGLKENITDYDLDNLLQKKYLHSRLSKLKVLIIDEISMVSPEIFESLDRILRTFQFSPELFGRVQIIMAGDFFQLPPVSKIKKEKKFVWQTELWEELDVKICYLEKKYRQDDEVLINILDEIRAGKVSEKTMNIFRGRYKKNTIGNFQETKLYTHNIDVDRINFQELDKLDTKLRIFKAKTSGTSKNCEKILKRSILAEELKLKKGAIVVFIKNNYQQGYLNGTLGKIINFNKDTGNPIVEITTGEKITLDYESWHWDDDGKIIAEVKQIPLRLAWAITVHKSQGMTLDSAEMDLSKTFEAGQGYVALSRIRSIEGLKLMGLNKTALTINQDVLKIDKIMKIKSQENFKQQEQKEDAEIQKNHQDFIKKIGGSQIKNKQIIKKKDNIFKSSTYEKTAELLKEKKSILEISQERNIQEKTIISHLTKILKDFPDIDLDYLKPNQKIIDQVSDTYKQLNSNRENKENFLPNGQLKLKPIFQALNEKISYEDIKIALCFIKK